MTSIICDFCGKKIEKRPFKVEGNFSLTKGTALYPFKIIEIKFSAQFNTTSLDWCAECFLKALKAADFIIN